MDQTFYVLDAAIDRLNITFVRTGNCISDTERLVHTNQEEPHNGNDCLAKLVEPTD